MRIWFEGWFEGRFEAWFKGASNQHYFCGIGTTTLSGLKLGLKVSLINVATP